MTVFRRVTGGWRGAVAGGLVFVALAAPPAMAGGVTVERPWFRYLLPSISAAGYMVLHNPTDAVATLTGAASPACGMLMLHESQADSGTATMVMVPRLDIPPHADLALAPGGYHLMCMQPKMRVEQKVPVTLDFADGSQLHVAAPVFGAQGEP